MCQTQICSLLPVLRGVFALEGCCEQGVFCKDTLSLRHSGQDGFGSKYHLYFNCHYYANPSWVVSLPQANWPAAFVRQLSSASVMVAL